MALNAIGWGAAAVTGFSVLSKVAKHGGIPTRVSCWFCSNKQTVPFSRRNCWDCTECGQYNGFSKDGDYNKIIKEQYADVPVNPTKHFATPARLPESESKLCDTCNRNQEMKLYQLRKFSPADPKNEDKELEEYSAHLERTYRLCRPCEAKVRQVIGEQDSWLKPELLSWKLSLFRKSPLISAQKMLPGDLTWPLMTRLLLVLLSLVLWLGSLHGTKFELLLTWLISKVQTFCDLPDNFGYFDLVTILVPLAFTIGYLNSPASSIMNSRLHMASIGCWLALFAQRVVGNTSFKFELATLTLVLTVLTACQRTASKCEKVRKKRDVRKKMYDQQLQAADSNDYSDQEVEISNGPTRSTSPCEPSTPSLKSNSNVPSPFDCYLPDHEIFQKNNHCDISTLSINNGTRNDSRPQSPFSVKNYQAESQSSINFGDFSRLKPQDTFIKPARFVYNERNRVAQSSWVAGGYWHSKQNVDTNETLSRSSSHSSGFGSLTSAAGLNHNNQSKFLSSLPNSRMNSTCGGDLLERQSIFSEPILRQGSQFSLNSTLKPTKQAGNNFGMLNATRNLHDITEIRSRSVLGDDDDDHDSFSSSIGRLSQEAFAKLQPKAESSPKDLLKTIHIKQEDVSFLEKKITINVTMYSLFLFISIAVNVSLSVYLVTRFFWQ